LKIKTEDMQIEFIKARSAEEFDEGKKLFAEYAESLGFDLAYQDFAKELAEIDIQYNLPSGLLILIKCEDIYIGCAGIRAFEKNIAELKRMYINPEYRALGLGKKLLDHGIAFAKQAGYHFIRLDTIKTMRTAIYIYREYGFYEIKPYRYNPSTEVFYMEKKL
jgi:putative acetyltransferase